MNCWLCVTPTHVSSMLIQNLKRNSIHFNMRGRGTWLFKAMLHFVRNLNEKKNKGVETQLQCFVARKNWIDGVKIKPSFKNPKIWKNTWKERKRKGKLNIMWCLKRQILHIHACSHLKKNIKLFLKCASFQRSRSVWGWGELSPL